MEQSIMKKLLLTLALLLAPGLAWGQCNGVFAAATLCGSGAGGVPGPVLASSFPFGQLTVGGLTINPAAGATVPGLTITQTLTGAVGFGGNAANLNFIASDNAQAGAGFLNYFEVSANFGGSATTGGRETIAAFLNLSAPTNASNSNRNYVSLYGSAFSAAGDGGTNTGAGSKGGLFPLATWGDLQSGATNMQGIGNEFDISVRTGASVRYKTALSLIEHALDGVSGAGKDTLLAFSGQAGAIGMNTLITIDDFASQHPLKATGTIMATATVGAGATVANGIDLSSGYTFTGYSLHLPGFGIASTGLVGIGSQTSTIPLDINANANAASVPAPQTNTVMRVVGADSTSAIMQFDGFNTNPAMLFTRANGSAAVKTGLVANDVIGQNIFRGWTSAAAYSGNAAQIRAIATETWSGTALGSQIDFRIVPNTTTTLTTAMSVFNSGGVGVGAAAADPGVGKINAANGYNSGGSAGLSVTKTVRAAGGAGDCTLIFTGGLLTGGSC